MTIGPKRSEARTDGPLRAGLVAAILLAAACDGTASTPTSEDQASRSNEPPAAVATVSLEAAASEELVTRGQALVQRYECNRCHEIDDVAAPPIGNDCAGCHREIIAGRFDAPADQLAHWQANLRSLLEVPALASTDRFRRAWVAGFLGSSHEVRPNLPASMPRFEMPDEDADAIAAFLVPTAEQAPPELGDPRRGRKVLEDKGCASCHRFTGVPALPANSPPVDLTAEAFSRGQRLAPDLRYARDRLRPAALVQWLRDPQSAKAGAAMPVIEMTDDEVADAAAYLLQAPLADGEPPDVPQRLPVLDREVTFAEVDEKVFSKICRHCHAGPEVVAGGGPGYAGGFGFSPRKLDLSSYQGIRHGGLDDDGHRRSVLAPGPDGTPRLVAHLWARHAEQAGQPVQGVRGMPLGLPPLPLEDIQLVETWIAQGGRAR